MTIIGSSVGQMAKDEHRPSVSDLSPPILALPSAPDLSPSSSNHSLDVIHTHTAPLLFSLGTFTATHQNTPLKTRKSHAEVFCISPSSSLPYLPFLLPHNPPQYTSPHQSPCPTNLGSPPSGLLCHLRISPEGFALMVHACNAATGHGENIL